MSRKQDTKQKSALTARRMAGNIASGLVNRYSTNDLLKDPKRQQRIAEVSASIARRIVKELA